MNTFPVPRRASSETEEITINETTTVTPNIYFTHHAIDQLDNRHRPMYHSHIITAWQNIKAHVWAFLKRRNRWTHRS